MNIKIKNTSFEIEKSDYDLFWKDIGTGKWEPETFNILDRFVTKNSTVIDIGCWGGPISLYAANIADKVFAIDPDPEIFTHLQNNIRLNPAISGKIKCFNLAITSESGEMLLFAREKYGLSSSSVLPRIRDGVSSQKVKTKSLAELIKEEGIQNVSFVKMDIEGGEFDLLHNVEKALALMNYPTLLVSFHYNYLREHRYYLHVKNKLLSKILMKTEDLLNIDLFKNKNRIAILNAIKAFKNYKFIYTENGVTLNIEALIKDPLIIKNHSLVVSNKEWE